MDMNEYVLEKMVAERLEEMRRYAARHQCAEAARPARRSLRVALGHALIRTGNRLLGGFAAARAAA